MLIPVSTNEYVNYHEIVSILIMEGEEREESFISDVPRDVDVYAITMKGGREIAIWEENYQMFKKQIDDYNADIITQRIDWRKLDAN